MILLLGSVIFCKFVVAFCLVILVGFLISCFKGANPSNVVKVHDNVNEGVEESKKGGMAARNKTGSRPNREGHDTMVYNV